MADFDDLEFDRQPAPNLLPPARSGPPIWPIAAGVGVLAVALGALWYFGGREKPAPQPQRTLPKATVELPRRAGEPGEAIDLPPLDQSDGVVRMLVGKLSSHPAVAAWLTTDGLIRNGTLVVHNIADGQTPAKQLKPLKPQGAFRVTTSRGATWIDPAGYSRYDGIADAVDGLDARGVARLYATVKPRIDDSYKELIGVDASFDRTLEKAIVMLLRTPIADGEIQVRTDKVTYAFANPSLEELTKVQRQFLRMGPRNMRIVKAKLRAIAGFLGIPDTALPPPDSNSNARD
jgi:hypothetical protein